MAIATVLKTVVRKDLQVRILYPPFVLLAVVAIAMSPLLAGAQRMQKTYIATMKADLRNLVTAQETYFSDSARYAATMDAFSASQFQFSGGVALVSLTASAQTFQARVRHSGSSSECWIAVGEVLPDGTPNLNDGEPQCDSIASTTGFPSKEWAIAYAGLFLLALAIRIARAEVPLPPIRGQTIFGFTLLALVHPFWPFLRDDSGGCLGLGNGPAVMAVIFMSYIAARMALRGAEESEPPRPA